MWLGRSKTWSDVSSLAGKILSSRTTSSIASQHWTKLVEHTPNDNYWGDGGYDGKGQNKLGVLLMDVRHVLRGEMDKKKVIKG